MTWSMPAITLSMVASGVLTGKLNRSVPRGPEDRQGERSMLVATLQRLFRHEAASGIVLMLASALALVLANSPMAGFYDLLLSLHGSVRIGSFSIEKPLLLWVNDGLMGIFFLLVGLEIKHEVLAGQLSDRRRGILPPSAALFGLAVPAVISLGASLQSPAAAH